MGSAHQTPPGIGSITPAWTIALLGAVALFVDAGDWLFVTLLSLALVVLIGRGTTTAARRTTLLLGIATVLLISAFRDDLGRLLEGKVRVWNVYHYYLGAKYFPELGYTDLYRATLAADREGDRVFDERVDKVRDLRTYEVVARQEATGDYEPSRHFSPRRWQEFKRDARALREHRSLDGWKNVFRDRGYNGTPLWTALGRLLGRVPADSKGLLLLCSLDLLLLAGVGALAVRAFGPGVTVLSLLLFVASPTNVPRIAGGLLQVDWLCAIVASVCLYRLQRERLAGACMAYAVMTRLFPAILVAGFCVPIVAGWLRGRRPGPPASRYLVSFGLCCLLGLALGLGNGRGVDGWREFVETITVHRDQHVLGDRRIGLEHAFTFDPGEFSSGTSDERREELLASRRAVSSVFAVLLGIGFLRAAARRSELDAQILSVGALFAALVLSRYYFGVLALLPWLDVSSERRRHLTAGQIAAFLGYFVSLALGADQHSAYAILNALLALHLGVALWQVGRLSSSGLERSPVAAPEASATSAARPS